MLTWLNYFGTTWNCPVVGRNPSPSPLDCQCQTFSAGWPVLELMQALWQKNTPTLWGGAKANNPRICWGQLNGSLIATSFLAHQNQRGRTCQHCLDTDHASQNCALAQPPSGRSGEEARPRPEHCWSQDPAATVKHILTGAMGGARPHTAGSDTSVPPAGQPATLM